MSITDFSEILIVDATGESMKMALVKGGAVAAARDGGKAMEDFFRTFAECAGGELANIGAFVLCTGTGSVLGTRTASVGLSVASIFNAAKMFEFNCMEVAAFALSEKIGGEFSLFTQSRRGYANILNFGGGVKLLREIPADEISALALPKRFTLRQRQKTDAALAGFEMLEMSAAEIAQTLLKHPELARECSDTPDAAPLTEREYAKWKAQAHI